MPPFRADLVGSLARPPALVAAREQHAQGELSAAALRALEDREIRRVVRRQEDIGLQVVTDGEFRRESWNRDFLLRLENVALGVSRIALPAQGERSQTRAPTALKVTGRIARSAPILVDAFAFLRSVARATPKVTLPSPTVLHFRGGREAIDRRAYPDIEEFYADVARIYREEIAALAAAGCTYLQIDDVNFAYLCDSRIAAQVRAMGEDPDALPAVYARLINAAIADRPAGMTVALHVCRGNAPSGWTEGGYEPVAEVLFNAIDVSAYFLEYDTPRAGGFAPLRLLPKGKTVVLGLVSTKTTALEDADELARRIEQAARFAPLEQLAISTQCGFSSGFKSAGIRGMTEERQFAKLQRVVDVARQVWR